MEVIFGKADCVPEETGFDSSRLDVLHRHFEKLIDKEIIYGAEYTISHKGKIIANASMGRGSSMEEKKMLPDTVFKIASITKPIATVALLQLVEEGLIRLDTDVFRRWHRNTDGIFLMMHTTFGTRRVILTG